jgi:hypothetical protein
MKEEVAMVPYEIAAVIHEGRLREVAAKRRRRQAARFRPYLPVEQAAPSRGRLFLVRAGELLVAFGARLKAHSAA